MARVQSLARFAKTMEGYVQAIDRNSTQLKVDIAKEVLAVVARSTPADTGLARTSWIVSVGQPSNEKPKKPYFPGSHLGMGELMNAQAAIGWGQLKLYPAVITRGQSIYIQNNQPYIGALNRGKSVQAGEGFVERAVLKGIVIALGRKLLPDSSGGVV